ncbi:MAG: DNA glycosylase AlkZ-like family protein, partial [Anaerolineales bacterium]
MLTIDIEIARRFILGKQGLWPGRRWRGAKGTEKAMRAMEYLQLDPLQIIARSHDLALHSRVLDYKPGLWERAAYKERKFFDWGGWLAVRPMDELPYWRVVMRHERDISPGIRKLGQEHAKAVAEMRNILREREIVSNRDFEMAARKRTQSYRGRKDSSLALYYLWRIGEVMTHHREKFERVYALTEKVAPPPLIIESDEDEVDAFLVKKEVSHYGLLRTKHVSDYFLRYASGRWKPTSLPSGTAKQITDALLANGELIEVKVDGWKE